MKKFAALALLLTLTAFSAAVQAAPVKLLFFYPGGQGSQEAAQPLLDAFAESLKKASGGKIEATVTYLSETQAGLDFIKAQKPAAAVLSLDAYLQYAPDWGATVVAKTLQLPSGDGTDRYFIVGKKGAALPTSGTLTLLSQRPFSPDFVAKQLFPQLSGLQFSVQALRNPVGALRTVGMGEKSDFILLDQFEYANVMRLRAAWVAGLAAAAESQKISSAPVVVFPGPGSAEFGAELQKALVKLGSDSSAQTTLQELRMKGFQAAQGL
ncbi:MAG: hypothetical protein IT572_04845 [Deltaproteobacteria bacterium]|nr:hypothetical protein [Deltaproteobacteria bacterium]